MTAVFRTLALALTLALVTAIPTVDRGSAGNSDSNIVFGSTRRGDGVGTSTQHGQTGATSVQRTAGDGQQINQGESRAVSTQEQTGLGGATQSTHNQGVAQSLQGAGGAGGAGAGGGGAQASTNQINIKSNQKQQNVEGSLINIKKANRGVVIVNTNTDNNARGSRKFGPSQHQTYDANVLLNIVDADEEVVFVITANKTEEEEPPSSNCRYVCIRPTNNAPYCCDDGSNRMSLPAIHGGQCPPLRFLCTRNVFFRTCAHDGQCAKSDKCCYDDCAEHHICKRADPVQ